MSNENNNSNNNNDNDNKPSGNIFNKLLGWIFIIGVGLVVISWDAEDFSLLIIGLIIAIISGALFFLFMPREKNPADTSSAEQGTLPQSENTQNIGAGQESLPQAEASQISIPQQPPAPVKCKKCEKETGVDGEKMYKIKDGALCAACYKIFLMDNMDKTALQKGKITAQNIKMLIGMLVGFAIGITLFFAVKASWYASIKWFVLIYLTVSFASIIFFIAYVVILFMSVHPFVVVFGFIIAFIGAPIYTIYKVIINPLNLYRLNKIRNINEEVLILICNPVTQSEDGGNAPDVPERLAAETLEMNTLLASLEERYK